MATQVSKEQGSIDYFFQMGDGAKTTLDEAKIAEKPSDCLNATLKKKSNRKGHVSAQKHSATRGQHLYFISIMVSLKTPTIILRKLGCNIVTGSTIN